MCVCLLQEYLDAIHHLYEEWLIKGGLFSVVAPVLVSPPTGQETLVEVIRGMWAALQSGEGLGPSELKNREEGNGKGERDTHTLSLSLSLFPLSI